MDVKFNVNPNIFSVSTELPPLICDAIRDWESCSETERIIEYAHAKMNNDVRDGRSSMIKWLHESNWLPSVLLAYVGNINRRYFGYELVGYDNEVIQFTKYGVGDHYDWHLDEDRNPFELMQNNSGEFVRKLSYTFQLSDPNDYEGGVLEFQNPMNTKEVHVIEKKQGLITVFDSRVPHRVTEVTSGTRYSLVSWNLGDPFK